MTTKPRSEAGFSIVAVLIVMGVVLFSLMLISQAKFRAQSTQKAIKTKQSYADVNQALINSVVEKIHGSMQKSCNGIVQTKLKNVALDGASKYDFSTALTRTNGIAAPQTHKEAINRCKTPKNPGTGGNRFYFCVELNKDASAPIDSILNSQYAFAEFAVELIDLQTTEPITCDKYTTRKNDKEGGVARDGSAGMAVTMALYWANQAGRGGKYNFSQKALSYIANQN